MPNYSWKSKSVIFLSFLMTISPRILVFGYFSGGTIGFLIFSVTYCATFFPPTVLMYQKIQAKIDFGKYLQNLFWAFLSGPVSPCIVIHPRSKTLLISSVSSVIAHLALTIYHYFDLRNLVEILGSEHQWYWKWRIPNHEDEVHMVLLGILMGLLLISLFFSGILHFLSKGKMKSACFSWCESKNSKKHSGEETGLNHIVENEEHEMVSLLPASLTIENETSGEFFYNSKKITSDALKIVPNTVVKHY